VKAQVGAFVKAIDLFLMRYLVCSVTKHDWEYQKPLAGYKQCKACESTSPMTALEIAAQRNQRRAQRDEEQ